MVLMLNGPNLNLLGQREPTVYGRDTLDDLARRSTAHGDSLGLDVEFRQSNGEGEIVGLIQQARGRAAALVVNAAAYTHTSIAILDALLAFDGPVIEVHLSNIFRREDFRHHSYVSRAANGVICGFGGFGYLLALEAAADLLARRGND